MAPRLILRGFAWTTVLILPYRYLDFRTLVGFAAGVLAGVSWCRLQRRPQDRCRLCGGGVDANALEEAAQSQEVPPLRPMEGGAEEAFVDMVPQVGSRLPPAIDSNCSLRQCASGGASSSSTSPPQLPRSLSLPAGGRVRAQPAEVQCFDLQALWKLFSPSGRGAGSPARRRRVAWGPEPEALAPDDGSHPGAVPAEANEARAANEDSAASSSKPPSPARSRTLRDLAKLKDAAKLYATRLHSRKGSQHQQKHMRHLRSWLSHGQWQFRLEEGVAWLDELCETVWPRIAKYVENLVAEVVEPAINARLPAFLRGNARFEEVSLGSTPPHFGPLTVYATEDKREIEIRLGVRFASDIKASLSAVGMRLGISKVEISGTVSVVFRPARNRPPFFGGLEVYLINPPTLDLEFHGAGRIADFPTIRPIVRSTIADVVSNLMVLPNRIAVDLDENDEMDIADLRHGDPQIVLRLEVRHANGLLAADLSLIGAASSDPYVVVTLGATRRTSPVVKKNLNPQWNFVADYPVHDPGQLVSFSVYDQDEYSADDLIGVASGVQLVTLIDAPDGARVPLSDSKGAPGAGNLTVCSVYMELTENTEGAKGAYVAMKIRQVQGLQRGSLFPFKAHVSVAGIEGSTRRSYAPGVRYLSADMQALCAKLLSEGRSQEVVAGILGLDVQDVVRVLNSRSPSDPALEKAAKDAIAERAACNPQFEDVVQLLLPDPQAALRPCTVTIRVLDKKGALVDSVHIDLQRVLASPGLLLDGPFELAASGARLFGSLRLRFCQELSGEDAIAIGERS